MRLYDAAAIVRSKNAGPFAVTIDLFFPDEERYRLARSSALLTPPIPTIGMRTASYT